MVKQTEIPGTGRKRIPELERSCEHLISSREAKKKAIDEEKAAAEKVQIHLAKHNLHAYVYVDGDLELLVSRETREATKVTELNRKRKASDSEDLT